MSSAALDELSVMSPEYIGAYCSLHVYSVAWATEDGPELIHAFQSHITNLVIFSVARIEFSDLVVECPKTPHLG